jgi:hypothetical protein
MEGFYDTTMSSGVIVEEDRDKVYVHKGNNFSMVLQVHKVFRS